MTNAIARLISIVGHPAVLMPVVAAVASSRSNDTRTLVISTAAAVAVAAAVMIYSTIRTKQGRWQHVDASVKDERAELNRVFGPLLLLLAILAALAGIHQGVAIVLALSGLIVITGHLFSRIAKPSLHVAFAAFATLIVWPSALATVVLALTAGAVAWSRLVLKRHTRRDVVLGFLTGLTAGVSFQILLGLLS